MYPARLSTCVPRKLTLGQIPIAHYLHLSLSASDVSIVPPYPHFHLPAPSPCRVTPSLIEVHLGESIVPTDRTSQPVPLRSTRLLPCTAAPPAGRRKTSQCQILRASPAPHIRPHVRASRRTDPSPVIRMTAWRDHHVADELLEADVALLVVLLLTITRPLWLPSCSLPTWHQRLLLLVPLLRSLHLLDPSLLSRPIATGHADRWRLRGSLFGRPGPRFAGSMRPIRDALKLISASCTIPRLQRARTTHFNGWMRSFEVKPGREPAKATSGVQKRGDGGNLSLIQVMFQVGNRQRPVLKLQRFFPFSQF